MIEAMLEAERALAVGLLDQADRLYRQVATADPQNAIAIVGLARVALERGDERTAYVEARRALAIDPDNPMASHLVMRMAEVLRARGEALPGETTSDAAARQTVPEAAPSETVPDASAPGPSGPRSLVDRVLRRHG